VKPAIVVVYSLSGHTRQLGDEIARRLDCPIAAITDARSRRGGLAYLRSGFEALFARQGEIQRFEPDLRDYRLVVVGTPVWVGHLSSPARAFLVQQRNNIQRLAAFCTMGGQHPANLFTDIAAVAGQALVATLAVPERELSASRHATRLEAFLAPLRSAAAG